MKMAMLTDLMLENISYQEELLIIITSSIEKNFMTNKTIQIN